MTITVLIAPDGAVVAHQFGKKTVTGFFSLIDHKRYVELRGTAFFPGEAEPYTLAPGYRLEHHDLAELLARPKSRASIDVHIRGLPGLEVYVDKQIAEVVQPLIRERDGLTRCLAAVPATHQQLALAAYRQGHEHGVQYEQTAHYESEGWTEDYDITLAKPWGDE